MLINKQHLGKTVLTLRFDGQPYQFTIDKISEDGRFFQDKGYTSWEVSEHFGVVEVLTEFTLEQIRERKLRAENEGLRLKLMTLNEERDNEEATSVWKARALSQERVSIEFQKKLVAANKEIEGWTQEVTSQNEKIDGLQEELSAFRQKSNNDEATIELNGKLREDNNFLADTIAAQEREFEDVAFELKRRIKELESLLAADQYNRFGLI